MTEANPHSDSYAALPKTLGPEDARMIAGVVTPPRVSCGYGNSSHYASLAKSFASYGVRVFTGEASELLNNPSIDFVVGVEALFDNVPERLKGHVYDIDYTALAKKVCRGAIYSQTPEGKMEFGFDWDVKPCALNFHGVRIIGYYSDYRGLDTAMDHIEQDDDDHSYERTRFMDYAKSMFALADFTVEADKRAVISEAAEQRKEHVDVAILLGGAPPAGMSGLVDYCKDLMLDLCNRDVSVALYTGDVQDARARNSFEALKDTHPVYGKMPYPNYMRAISGARVIITKPGWNTVSDVIYLSQRISPQKSPPVCMFLPNPYSIPEMIAQGVMERRGFDFIDTSKGPGDLGARLEALLSDKEALEAARKESWITCDQPHVTTIAGKIHDAESKGKMVSRWE